MQIKEALQLGRRLLKKAGSSCAALECSLLLQKLTGLSRTRLIACDEEELPLASEQEFKRLLRLLLDGYPMAYILGQREFYGLMLEVDESVLIPRPDTETLVDEALGEPFASVLDLGTGSGAVILALKSCRPQAEAWASDLSSQALSVARRNARALGLEVTLVQGSWYSGLPARRFDLIVSNPPYVASGDVHLCQGSLPWEPTLALCAGPDGLAALRSIVSGAGAFLNPGGRLLLEHGFDQGENCRSLLQQAGFVQVHSCTDLAGRERVSGGVLPGGRIAVPGAALDDGAEGTDEKAVQALKK